MLTYGSTVNTAVTDMAFDCGYCGKSFQKESTLEVHLCEIKRRHRDRDERGVQLGLNAYLRFYETAQGSSRFRSWDDFVTSSYYRAFVKWGRYCVNTRVINPARFLDWLLKNNKKIDRWASDSVYTEYLLDYLLLEAVEDALERAISWSLDWAEQNGCDSRDVLRYGNSHAVCHAIVTGRLSAWVIYNCESGQRFLEQCHAKETEMIWPYIDADRWSKKFSNYPADQEYASSLLEKAGW